MRTKSLIWMLVAWAGLVALGCGSAYGQAEIDPDHFEAPPAGPPQGAKTQPVKRAAAFRYKGKFTLPYPLQCKGKNLPPGPYSVSLLADGKMGRATLNQKGQVTEIVGLVRTRAEKRKIAALVVGHAGKTRSLSALQVAELDLIFDPKLKLENLSSKMSASTEKLPIMAIERNGR